MFAFYWARALDAVARVYFYGVGYAYSAVAVAVAVDDLTTFDWFGLVWCIRRMCLNRFN